MNSLPVILRARDFRLYTQGGGHLVDLWQAGGRAVLGHSPPQVFRDFKNYGGRGLFAPLPHPQERRLDKALSRLLPGRVFRFYMDRLSLRSALEAAGFPWRPLPDPALPGGASPPGESLAPGPPALWRPFLEEGDKPQNPPGPGACPVLVPVLPWPLAPWVLAPEAVLEDRFPPSEPLPPVLLAAAARAVYDLIAAGKRGGRPVYPRINRALYGTSAGEHFWRRRGIYLSCPALQAREGPLQIQGEGPSLGPASPLPSPPADWEDLYRCFLDAGFLIPPGPGEPLILPGFLSPGEEAKLAALLGSTF
jgi:hypothetical protein